MPRNYHRHQIEQLEQLFKDNLHNRQVLGEIRDELTYRETERAKQLLREIEAVLTGKVAVPPKPPRPSTPEDQIPLLDG